MPGNVNYCKGEIHWKGAVRNDSRDDLVAK